MTTLGKIGRGALGLGVGGLGLLAAMKVREDQRVEALWRSFMDIGRPGEAFNEEMVADLPDSARRYFLHAIRPGAPLASTLHWHYTGELRTGEKRPGCGWKPSRLSFAGAASSGRRG